ncbi:MAG TPA: TadE family protein [Candidatus Nitrosotenuis sp.]|nr:TadE family protein [Candidatus Nitrosotenuis sp.]
MRIIKLQFLKLFRILRHREQGGALIEFAFMIPIFFLFFAGILNFGYVAKGFLQLNIAMNAGITYGLSNPDKVNNISNIMSNAVSIPMTITVLQFCECSNGTRLGCSIPCLDLSLPGTFVSIEAQTSLTLPMYNFILSNPYTINEKIIFRIK